MKIRDCTATKKTYFGQVVPLFRPQPRRQRACRDLRPPNSMLPHLGWDVRPAHELVPCGSLRLFLVRDALLARVVILRGQRGDHVEVAAILGRGE